MLFCIKFFHDSRKILERITFYSAKFGIREDFYVFIFELYEGIMNI